MIEKILMTSPYPQMTLTIREISQKLHIPIKIIEATMGEAAHLVKEEIKKNNSIEVVISRAGTFEEIYKRKIDRPIIYCDNSDFDILEAIWNARKLGRNIGFLTYQDQRYPYKIDKLNQILGFKVHLYPYENWSNLKEQVHNAYVDGIDVIVGGGTKAMKLVSDKGMKGMHITTNPRTIARAILQADEIAKHRIQTREKAEQLNTILDISEDPIIVTDKSGRITYFNAMAESILQIRAEQAVNLAPGDVLAIDSIYQIVQSSPKEIIRLSGKRFIVEIKLIRNETDVIGKVYTLKQVDKIQKLETEIRKEVYQKGLIAKHSFDDILHNSERMSELILKAKKYSRTDSTVLITGESGTGKELFAQGIHNSSERKGGPFVAVNCASIPENLLESEFFGYAEGAFTGAKKGGKAGVFEIAHGGTIFLDEIGEITPRIQAVLLRVLQEKEIMRVGGDRLIPVDVRVIAATNKPLWDKVQKGEFREDLYYRLNVLRIQIPPLRERKEDIPLIVNHLFRRHNERFVTWENLLKSQKRFFLEYSWPGNIRQLENVIERMVLNKSVLNNPNYMIEEIMDEHRINGISNIKTPSLSSQKKYILISPGKMEEMETEIMEQMLEMHGNNRGLVAEKLGISRTTLWKKLKEKQQKDKDDQNA